jgi:hypothetical protein
MGVEKAIVSKMLVEGSNRRLFSVDMHTGVVRIATTASFPCRPFLNERDLSSPRELAGFRRMPGNL